MTKRLLVLDSNSIINRAFYGIGALSAPDGTPTNAIYGFMNILFKLVNDCKPDYIMAAFDLKAPTFRHKLYDKYKATRSPMPDDLACQMPIMKNILSLMNIPILELAGYEADDIIGTVSRVCEESGVRCFIATGDRDDLQLVGNGTEVVLASTKFGRSVTELYDAAAVEAKYGVTPERIVDLKALMGDTSDNIPGVHGVGEKTAAKLISKWATLENMYAHLDELAVGAKIKNSLETEKETAFLSRTLSRIDRHVPMKIDIESGAYDGGGFDPALYSELARLGLKTVIKKLGLTPPPETAQECVADIFEGTDISVVGDAAAFADAVRGYGSPVSVYVKTDNGAVTEIGCSDGKRAVCISGTFEVTDGIAEILADENIKKNVCGIKDAIVALDGAAEFNGIDFDCAIAAYLCDPSGAFDIDSLAMAYLGVTFGCDTAAQLSLFDEDTESDTAARKAIAISALTDKLKSRIESEGRHDLFYDVEMPLIKVLAQMQILGVSVDSDALSEFGGILSEKCAELERRVHSAAGEEFNVNSPKQLGHILFEKLRLPGGKKTKNGYSTKADILEKLRGEYKIVDDVLDYRMYQKLKSTYCDGLGALIDRRTNRIHSVFHQTGTVTGRLSSSDPNMQNIPTRTAIGRELRKMFVAGDGRVLVDADYSQIELRVLAHLSHDEMMIQAFKSGMDIHAVTASKILGIPIEEITPEQRTSAKAINFGIVYGMSEYTLSKDLNISYGAAKDYMDSYFKKYSGVKRYMDALKAKARETGYVTTMMNRIRYIPELKSPNAQLRSYGERAAMNTPVQGSAADIIKLAMVRVYNRLAAEGLKSKLILQVHDELIVESPVSEAETVCGILKYEMENAVRLDVPLIAEPKIGKRWYDTK